MQEPRTHAQRAVSSPGEEPVASLLGCLAARLAWTNLGNNSILKRTNDLGAPKHRQAGRHRAARADCRLIKMVIVFSGRAQGVSEREGEEERDGLARRLQRLFMCGFCKNY